MMASNPLKLAAIPHFQSKMTAREWAALARQKGLLEHAKAWDARAEDLGE